MVPQAIPSLALVKQPSAALSPFAPGRIFAAGIRTLLSPMLEVVDARIESLLCKSTAVNPGVEVSTRNPWILSLSPTFAQTTATSASEPFVIQVFSPLIT